MERPQIAITLPKIVSEEIFFVFDFQQFPEVVAGETISDPVVSTVEANPSTVLTGTLTIGAHAVTSEDIIDGEKTVPAGKGVSCLIKNGTRSAIYTVDCIVSLSGGGKRTRRGYIKVM
jgi:hypothetical protein